MTNKISNNGPLRARVLVVDDHPIFRDGLVQLINRQANLTCCAEIGEATAVLETVERTQPNLVMLDLRLGAADRLDLISDLKARFPQIPVLVLSQWDEALYAERVLRAGAQGYVMKERAAEEVLTAIMAVLGGELYVSRQIALRIMHDFLDRDATAEIDGIASLSNRQLQVFQLLGGGLSTHQIASELHLSHKTIETHRESIKHKLNLPDANALIREAVAWVQKGSVMPDRPRFPSNGRATTTAPQRTGKSPLPRH